jgi:hypothetical protein
MKALRARVAARLAAGDTFEHALNHHVFTNACTQILERRQVLRTQPPLFLRTMNH